MSSEYAAKLEDAAFALEQAMNLMQIFFEFTQDEGYISENDSFEDVKNKSVAFIERHPVYETVLTSAFDIVKDQKDRINKISDELYTMNKKEKAA